MTAKKTLNLTLKIWRQKTAKQKDSLKYIKFLKFLLIHLFWKCLIF